MSQRVMCTALLGANVFQNVFRGVLAKQTPLQEYYVDLIRRLASRPVEWYMTVYDYNLARSFLELFILRKNDAYQEAYLDLLRLVKICPIDEYILEEAGYHQSLNFCDAFRLACAMDRNLDAIVTWEPEMFVRTFNEHHQFERNGFFKINLPTQTFEPINRYESRSISVFSVRAFLLNLDSELRSCHSPQPQHFRLEDMRFFYERENQAYVILRGPEGMCLEAVAQGNSPFDAIQKAIDQAVEQCLPAMPPRYISYFFIPLATLSGADSPIEVVLQVECAGQSFQESASHSSVLRAATDAYVRVINRICHNPNLPNVA